MPKVICTLPNASTEINGVAFTATDGGMLSEELSAARAAEFLSIHGYVEHHEDADEVAAQKAEAASVAQREAEEAAQRSAAAKPVPKATAKPQKPVKVEPVAPVEPSAPVVPVVVAADDDTTF